MLSKDGYEWSVGRRWSGKDLISARDLLHRVLFRIEDGQAQCIQIELDVFGFTRHQLNPTERDQTFVGLPCGWRQPSINLHDFSTRAPPGVLDGHGGSPAVAVDTQSGILIGGIGQAKAKGKQRL